MTQNDIVTKFSQFVQKAESLLNTNDRLNLGYYVGQAQILSQIAVPQFMNKVLLGRFREYSVRFDELVNKLRNP